MYFYIWKNSFNKNSLNWKQNNWSKKTQQKYQQTILSQDWSIDFSIYFMTNVPVIWCTSKFDLSLPHKIDYYMDMTDLPIIWSTLKADLLLYDLLWK